MQNKLLFLLLIPAFLFSCNKPTGIRDFVNGSDSVAINFFKGDGSKDSVVKMIMIRDTVGVKAMADFIESSRTDNMKCGYDGSIHFFKKDMVLKDIDFRMNETGCMHFTFVMNNQVYSTKLSARAKAFLESAKNK